MDRLDISSSLGVQGRYRVLNDAWETTKNSVDLEKAQSYEDKEWISVSSMIRLLDTTLIIIPNYSDGENHLQFLERYKQYLRKQIEEGQLNER